MLGGAPMLRAGALDEAGRERALEVIERNARAQAQLVEDLLDVSRIISGKLCLRVAPVDLRAVVEAALEALRPAAGAKAVSLSADVVRAHARREGGHVVLSVEDSGAGVDPRVPALRLRAPPPGRGRRDGGPPPSGGGRPLPGVLR